MPAFTGDLVSTLLPSAVLIAVVGYVISVSIAKTFSNKHGYKIDSNQVRPWRRRKAFDILPLWF